MSMKRNKFIEFIESQKGKHQIGGKKPSNFKYPKNEFLANFQYIGFINRDDDLFKWLPFNLHLICPIYLDIEEVYLDYSIENAPTIIKPQKTSEITSGFDDLTIDSYIEFDTRKLELVESVEIDDFECIGVAKYPFSSLENVHVPICPKSGRKMKFVCQLMTFGRIPTKERNFKSSDEYLDEYYQFMNFWCDGSLFVFIEPDTKIVCYFIENT